MPIRVGCPDCGAVVNAPDSKAGATVNCPKCAAPMILPGAMPLPKAKRLPLEEPVRRRPGNDNDDAAPFEPLEEGPARRRSRQDDYEEVRPRRSRRDEDDDDDDRPRRKKKSGPVIPIAAMIGGGIALGLLVLIGGLWAAGVFKGSAKNAAGGTTTTSGLTAPIGWTVAQGESFSAFMRGNAMKSNFNSGATTRSTPQGGTGRYELWHSRSDGENYTIHALNYERFSPEPTVAGLFAEADSLNHGDFIEAAWTVVTDKSLGTHQGHPCLNLRWHHNDNWQDEQIRANETPQMKAMREKMEAENPRPPRAGSKRVEHYAARVLVAGQKVYVLHVHFEGKVANEASVKTFFDSLEVK